jgi:serine/threonine-protein kinase
MLNQLLGGQLLGGRYRVLQALGEGGLAKTYIAEDRHRPGHPKCAVKFLKPASNAPDFLPIARRLFNKEAEILEKLGQHDRIPRLLAYFEENQEFYLVQEFIEGHTLSTELLPGSCWSESKVIQMLQDVLQTLEFVHSYGVIHRDIKPNNLIRRQKDGRLVLIDFGAVKQVRDPRITTRTLLTQKTISIGTPGYMPTEQVRGKPRLNSDIYALGMVAIQALTGVDPLYLEEDTDGEVIWQNRTEVSDELAAILTNMVRYHFKDRYQSATEVLQALQPLGDPYTLIRSTSGTRQASPEVAPKPELRETRVSLGLERPEAELRETKVALDLKQPSSEAVPKAELQETKVSLGIERPEAELRETKVSLGIERPDAEAVPETKLRETKVALGLGQPSSEIASEKEEKVSLVSPAGSLTPSKDLELSHAPIFALLNKSRLLIAAAIASVLVSIFAGYTYMTYRQSYSQAQEALEQIGVLKAAEKYKECLQQARTFPKDHSDLYAEVETLLHECQQGQAEEYLTEAKKLAEQSRLKDAIALAVQVPTDMDIHSEAVKLMSQWSEKIFQIASNKYQEGNLKEAVAIAGAVPSDSPLIPRVQAAIQQWNEEWKQNELHLQAAQKALDERRWQDAINTAKKVSNTAYWQKQSEPIIQKAEAEIAAAQAATSRRTYKPRSSSTSSRSSSTSPRSSPTSPRSSSTSPRSSSTSPRSSSTSPRSSPARPYYTKLDKIRSQMHR